MSYFCGLPVSYNYICFSVEDRPHEILDIPSWILIIRIGIHEYVSLVLESILYTCLECTAQTTILLERDDVVHSDLLRYKCRIVS